MPGHIRKRTYKNKQGKVTGEGYQARYEDPTDPSKRVEKTFRTKRAASDWLATQRTSVLSGTHVDPRRGDRPFAAVVDAWRASWIGLEPKTRAGYESILSKHLTPTFGRRRVSTITPEVVQAYVNGLSEGGLAPATVRSIYSVLRSALTAAVRLRMLPSSPCVGVRLPRATKNEQHYLTAAQVTSVAEAIDPHYRVAVYTAAWTGLRSGELWALRRKDVDLLRGSIHVRRALKEHYSSKLPPEERGLAFGPTKTHGDRVVSLPRFLRTMLDEHMATLPGGEDTLIFTTPSGTPVRHGLFYRRVFKPAVQGRPAVEAQPARRGRAAVEAQPAIPGALPADLHGLRFHDLRHTCASLSISQGAHPLLVKQRLGHSSIEITMDRYGHLFPSAEEALCAGLDAAYEASSSPAGNVLSLPQR